MQTLTTQLTAHQRVQQIIQALLTLPPEKISEVWDFVAFLQGRYAGTPSVDVNDTWTDQNTTDLSTASLVYAAPLHTAFHLASGKTDVDSTGSSRTPA